MKIIRNNLELKFFLSLNFDHFQYLYDLTKKELENRSGLEVSDDLVIGAMGYFASNELNFWISPKLVESTNSIYTVMRESFFLDIDKVVAQFKENIHASKK